MLLPREHMVFAIWFGVGWVALVTFLSVMYRRSRGKPICRPQFQNALFLETWRSGRSLKNALTRLGGARNCLWIAVTDDTLLVAPHFPFNLLFLPEIYHLEHSVPGPSIRNVEIADGFLIRGRIRITMKKRDSDDETIELHLRDPEGFIRAIETIRR